MRSVYISIIIVAICLIMIASQVNHSGKEKHVIIRIDDIWCLENNSLQEYGYTFDGLERIYNIIDNYDFKGVISITPFIYDEKIGNAHPLENDAQVLEFIEKVKNRKWEIAQHGYSHCGEYPHCYNYHENITTIETGKLYLENLLHTNIQTYVSPQGLWRKGILSSVKEVDFKVATVDSSAFIGWDNDLLITPKSFDVVDRWGWFPKNFPFKNYDEWIKEFKNRDIFILVLHYNTFDSEEKFKMLDNFLSHVNKSQAKVVTYRDLYKTLMSVPINNS